MTSPDTGRDGFRNSKCLLRSQTYSQGSFNAYKRSSKAECLDFHHFRGFSQLWVIFCAFCCLTGEEHLYSIDTARRLLIKVPCHTCSHKDFNKKKLNKKSRLGFYNDHSRKCNNEMTHQKCASRLYLSLQCLLLVFVPMSCSFKVFLNHTNKDEY